MSDTLSPSPDQSSRPVVKEYGTPNPTISELYCMGYQIPLAKTETEALEILKQILQYAPYTSIVLLSCPSGYQITLVIDPRTPEEQFSSYLNRIIPTNETPTIFGEEISISDRIEPEKLPLSLQEIINLLNITQYAIIPIHKNVELSIWLILGSWFSNPITNDDIDPYFKITELFATILEKIRTSKKIEQRLLELEAITETSLSISATSDLIELYQILHKHVRQVIGDIGFLVALFDSTTNSIRIPYLYEKDNTEITSIDPFPLGEGLTSLLIKTRKPLLLVENTEQQAISLGAKIIGQPAKSWLGVPILTGDETIGALIVQDTDKEKAFDESDLSFIQSLSAQVAGALNNTRLLQETRFLAIQLQTAAQIARDISGSLNLSELLNKAVNLVRDQLKYYHAAIFLLNEDNNFAVIREATGEAGIQLKRAGHKIAVGSKSMVGFVTRSGELLIVNDTNHDALYLPNPLLPDTRAELTIPLRVGSRILGVLDVQSRSAYSFNEQAVNVLRILADQLAIAVINSELYAESQELLAQHRLLHHVTTAVASGTTLDEALSSAVQGLQVTLGGDCVAILITDKEKRVLEVKSSAGYGESIGQMVVPFGEGITGWVAEHKQPLRIDDVTKDTRYIKVGQDIKSEIAIPLTYRNELLGVLNVESEGLAAYNQSDEEMLGTLCGSLAAIIANARLLEQIRQQIDRERILYEVTSKIRRSTDMDYIISTTAHELRKALGAHRAEITINSPVISQSTQNDHSQKQEIKDGFNSGEGRIKG